MAVSLRSSIAYDELALRAALEEAIESGNREDAAAAAFALADMRATLLERRAVLRPLPRVPAVLSRGDPAASPCRNSPLAGADVSRPGVPPKPPPRMHARPPGSVPLDPDYQNIIPGGVGRGGGREGLPAAAASPPQPPPAFPATSPGAAGSGADHDFVVLRASGTASASAPPDPDYQNVPWPPAPAAAAAREAGTVCADSAPSARSPPPLPVMPTVAVLLAPPARAEAAGAVPAPAPAVPASPPPAGAERAQLPKVMTLKKLPFFTRQRKGEQYADFAARLASFDERWPASAAPAAEALARAGFYFAPKPARKDRVKCFACSHMLYDWEPKDDPAVQHRSINPSCPHVRGLDAGDAPPAAPRAHVPDCASPSSAGSAPAATVAGAAGTGSNVSGHAAATAHAAVARPERPIGGTGGSFLVSLKHRALAGARPKGAPKVGGSHAKTAKEIERLRQLGLQQQFTKDLLPQAAPRQCSSLAELEAEIASVKRHMLAVEKMMSMCVGAGDATGLQKAEAQAEMLLQNLRVLQEQRVQIKPDGSTTPEQQQFSPPPMTTTTQQQPVLAASPAAEGAAATATASATAAPDVEREGDDVNGEFTPAKHGDWEQFVTEEGYIYWFNSATGDGQWEDPF